MSGVRNAPPLLPTFAVDMTYTINVVPEGHYAPASAQPPAASLDGAAFWSTPIADDRKRIDELMSNAAEGGAGLRGL